MGRQHSGLMLVLFPSQRGVGVDLGNIEIKESTAGFQTFTITRKDMSDDTEYFLFYDHQLEKFWFCPANKLPWVENKRSYRVTQVAKVALWETSDVVQVIENMRSYINDQKYLEVLYNEEE